MALQQTDEAGIGIEPVKLHNSAGTEVGTATAPLRTDPTGSTAQPISGTVTANQGTAGAAWPVSLASLPALAAGAAIAGAVKDAGPQQSVTRTFTQNNDISTARDITGAPTAGQKVVAMDVVVSVDTAAYVTIQEETSGTVFAAAYMAANTTASFTLRGYLKAGTADKKLQMKSSAASKGACTCIWFSEA